MFKLRIYGGKNIEETTDTFETLEEAKTYAERQCTDDTEGWDEKEDSWVLVDYNTSNKQEDLVINKITEV